MHQHPRQSPSMASSSSPRPNSTRSANPRTNSEGPLDNESEDGSGASGEIVSGSRPSDGAVRKLDQIVQNFHTKAAIVILQSRISMPSVLAKNNSRKVNKWFQLETDETESFREELRMWKTCGGFANRPPPLIVETYLDPSALTSNQSLVIVDDRGQRWDVFEALNRSPESADGSSSQRKRKADVILERWKIELIGPAEQDLYDFGATLPTIYKKCIIFFRSLFATAKFVPTWKFVRDLAKGSRNHHLRVNCRILNGHDVPVTRYDGLTYPLYDGDSPVTTEFDLGYTPCPAGRFSAKVTYRNHCNFRVDDSETLLSSQFMGADEGLFQPSLPVRSDSRRHDSRTLEIGSLPTNRQPVEDSGPVQAYGSMSTFHGNMFARGSSPISALRAAKPMGSDTSSPPSPAPRPGQIHTSRASISSTEGAALARRPSVSRSFQPFKAGSLSASPVPGTPTGRDGESMPPPSPHSTSRGSGISALSHARNRSSLTAGMPASLRGAPVAPDHAVTSSVSVSPKPAPLNRYNSSFSNRRGRISFGGTSRVVDDDQGSSGKQSLSSSAQPGSGILAEGGGGSSGSLQADDNDISDFLKLLDAQKTLKSFEPSHAEVSNKRTSAQLSKFQMMRESNNALGDSISSSVMLQRSSSSSSRQLTSVPPMIAATSISTSSSPGKPISPHTPHTPAIPSRLSANSIAEYVEPRRLPQRSRTSPETRISDFADEEDISTELATNAIDIPISPRQYFSHTRRSSSVAQQYRTTTAEDDLSISDLRYGVHRSISLGAEAGPAPSLSALLDSAQRTEIARESESLEGPRPPFQTSEASTRLPHHTFSSVEREEGPQMPRGINPLYRPRRGRVVGRGVTPPQGSSYSSLATDRGSGSGSDTRPSGRYSFTRPTGPYENDDEPLLFDMSEIGRDQSRRSLEEARGGAVVATNDRGSDSAFSSRRGSRRGW